MHNETGIATPDIIVKLKENYKPYPYSTRPITIQDDIILRKVRYARKIVK